MPSRTYAPRRFQFGSLLGLGFVTGFLYTLELGSFASTLETIVNQVVEGVR